MRRYLFNLINSEQETFVTYKLKKEITLISNPWGGGGGGSKLFSLLAEIRFKGVKKIFLKIGC